MAQYGLQNHQGKNMSKPIHYKYARDTDPINYFIVVIADHTQDELDALDGISLTQIATTRYNQEATKCIMKYRGEIPTLIIHYSTYSIDEIRTILNTSEWLSDDTGNA